MVVDKTAVLHREDGVNVGLGQLVIGHKAGPGRDALVERFQRGGLHGALVELVPLPAKGGRGGDQCHQQHPQQIADQPPEDTEEKFHSTNPFGSEV